MQIKTRLETWSEQAPGWMITLLPILAALAGGAVFWGGWHFYYERWHEADFAWYNWIRPLLLAGFCLLNLAAAPFLVFRKRFGWELLTLAYGIVPIFLMAGLVILGIRFLAFIAVWFYDRAGDLMNGTWREQMEFHPKLLTFLPLIIIALSLLVLWSKIRGKSNAKRGN